MANHNRYTFRLAFLATCLAFIVVLLGADTRLHDAGISCPDWPGCYGHLGVPMSTDQIAQANKLYPEMPVEPAKAWYEMIHRYFAGSLGIFILAMAIIAIARWRQTSQPRVVPLLLVALVIFQALLGMWTVTWKLLPGVVMGHLLGGMALLALLWLLTLQSAPSCCHKLNSSYEKLKPWALIGLMIVCVQIALGGWTSSNYAALICTGFPSCNGHLFPAMDFKTAFDIFSPIGINYFGGVLGTTARVTIQMTHRYFALITAIYIGLLSLNLLFSKRTTGLRILGLVILIILGLQISWGILNVLWLLPRPIAVAHNGFAALLLLSLVTLNFCVSRQHK